MKITVGLFLTFFFLPLILLVGDYGLNYKIVCSKSPLKQKCIAKYFTNHWVYKTQLNNISMFINKDILEKKITRNVHFGKEGWLFYASISDGNPLADLKGKPYTPEQEIKIIKHFEKIHKNRFGYDAPILSVIAPNKSRINKELTKLNLYHFKTPPYQKVMEKLTSNLQGYFISPQKLLNISNFRQRDSYLKMDTHWSQKGALLAYNMSVSTNFSQHLLQRDILTEQSLKQEGDLLKMLKTNWAEEQLNTDFKVLAVSPEKKCDKKEHEKGELKSEVYVFQCRGSGTALIIGDSFRTAFAAVASQAFATTYVTHHKDLDKFKKIYPNLKPDLIFYVTVERYLKQIN